MENIVRIVQNTRYLLEDYEDIKKTYKVLPLSEEIKIKIIFYLHEFMMNESKVPYGIEHLVLDGFLGKIYTEYLPTSLKKLTIDFKEPVSRKTVLPSHIREVVFGSDYDVDKKIHSNFFHPYIHTITFEESFSLSNLEGKLTEYLKRIYGVYDGLDKIPLNIEELKYYGRKNPDVFKMFSKLQFLDYFLMDFKSTYEVDENHFPESLYQLKLGSNRDILCKSLPKNIHYLSFKSEGTISIESLPNCIKNMYIECDNIIMKDSLPNSLEEMTLEMDRFDKESKIEFSENLRKIELNIRCVKMDLKIPSSVRILKLFCSSLLENIQLSKGLEEIYFHHMNDILDPNILNIESLQKIFVRFQSDKEKMMRKYKIQEERIFVKY